MGNGRQRCTANRAGTSTAVIGLNVAAIRQYIMISCWVTFDPSYKNTSQMRYIVEGGTQSMKIVSILPVPQGEREGAGRVNRYTNAGAFKETAAL